MGVQILNVTGRGNFQELSGPFKSIGNWAYSRLTSLLSMSVENEAITANIGRCFEGLDCVAYVFVF